MFSISVFTGSLEANELGDGSRHPDLLLFDLRCIVEATDNFSPTNKLGQGGFGSVFKVQSQFFYNVVNILHSFVSLSHSNVVGEWGKVDLLKELQIVLNCLKLISMSKLKF